MIARATILWIVGLVTIVPYGIYHLLFTAQRDEYAFLITGVLFWIFGFWGARFTHTLSGVLPGNPPVGEKKAAPWCGKVVNRSMPAHYPSKQQRHILLQ